jgi:hypothetical protein
MFFERAPHSGVHSPDAIGPLEERRQLVRSQLWWRDVNRVAQRGAGRRRCEIERPVHFDLVVFCLAHLEREQRHPAQASAVVECLDDASGRDTTRLRRS